MGIEMMGKILGTISLRHLVLERRIQQYATEGQDRNDQRRVNGDFIQARRCMGNNFRDIYEPIFYTASDFPTHIFQNAGSSCTRLTDHSIRAFVACIGRYGARKTIW